MNLRQQFDTIAGPEVVTTADDASADLDRGRRALSKRRTVQKLTGCAFAVAALVVGVAVANGGAPAATTSTVADGPGTVSAGAVRLVAYTGSQPKGYTVDKVPDGWEIQADSVYVLVIAPKAALDQDPYSVVGKIGVQLQHKDQLGVVPKGKQVMVGDAPGVLVPIDVDYDPTTLRLREQAKRDAIAKGGPSAAPFLVPDGDDGVTLWVKQPSGYYLQIQFWGGLGLSEQDKLTIGAGIHVHKDAVQDGS
jgi:hypothetical protein